MARKTNNAQSKDFKQADAFLRLSVKDKDGNLHRLPKDMAMYLEKHIHANMIKTANKNEEHEFTLVGQVHVVDNAPKEDVEF